MCPYQQKTHRGKDVASGKTKMKRIVKSFSFIPTVSDDPVLSNPEFLIVGLHLSSSSQNSQCLDSYQNPYFGNTDLSL